MRKLLILLIFICICTGCSSEDYEERLSQAEEISDAEMFCYNLEESVGKIHVNYAHASYQDWAIYSIWVNTDGSRRYVDSNGELSSETRISVKIRTDDSKPIWDFLHKYDDDDIPYFILFG